MANLRTNNLSGEQGQNAYRGSVLLESDSSSRISVTNTTGLDFGTDQFTIEFWIYLVGTAPVSKNIFARSTSNSGTTGMIMWFDSNGHLEFDSAHGVSGAVHTGAAIGNHMWHHIAVTRDSSNNTRLYLNGVNKASASNDTSNIVGATNLQIASNIGADGYYNDAYISNFRMVKGTAIYSGTTDFTPPQSELTVVDGTILLCCQDSNDPTQEATDKTITGFGNLATAGYLGTQPKVIPPYGVDAGNTFGGQIQQSSQGYMYFPTGRTEERGGSRGVCAGGSDPSGRDNDISFIDIQSQGNAIDFGDLSINSHNTAGFSSKTRAIFSLGYIDASPNVSNTLEFITMMTQGNATDFGDVSVTVYEAGAASNDTRGLIAGGYNASPLNNVTNIDFVTIASLGNGADFGDLTLGRRGLQGCGSPTRSVFASGYQQPDTGTKTNVIDFVTIATAGNAQDFGDLTSQRWGTAACSDSTRGVFSGGATPGELNTIDFITIATTGNAVDFGDLVTAAGRSSATSDRIRGVIFSAYSPSVNNIIEVLTIQTTGNSKDFGDTYKSTHSPGTASNAHGGLS